MREKKRTAPPQDEEKKKKKKQEKGWVSSHCTHSRCAQLCMQDAHHKRMDRYLKANAIGEGEDYAVTNFMIGDSLVFDFGGTRVVQDHFRQIGGVKVRLGDCVPVVPIAVAMIVGERDPWVDRDGVEAVPWGGPSNAVAMG